MDNLLTHTDPEPENTADIPLSRSLSSNQKQTLKVLVGLLAWLSLAASALLLLNDLPGLGLPLNHAPVSALPLLLIGLTSLAFQFVVRPGLLDLCKALIVSAAFLLWGLDQFLPPGWLATTLGDVVVILYVIDLGWMMLDRLRGPASVRPDTPDGHGP